MAEIDCIFCHIVKHEDRQSDTIKHEDDDFIVFPSKSPSADIHLLIVPKEHIQSIAHVEERHKELLGKLMQLASKMAKEKGVVDYRLVFNAGKYIQINHLHLHLLGGELKADHL